jgi:hypothetical protein
VFLFELFQLGFAKAQAFEFFELIAEQLMARALFVAGVGESLQFQAGLAPALGGQENLALGLVIYTVFCSGLTILTLSSICLNMGFF